MSYRIPVTVYETLEHHDLIKLISDLGLGHKIKSCYIDAMDIKVISGYAYKVYEVGVKS